MKSTSCLKIIPSVALGFTLSLITATAEDYELTADTSNWITVGPTGQWRDVATNTTAPSTLDDNSFFSNGFQVRTSTSGTFGDAGTSLTIQTGDGGSDPFLVRNTVSVATLITATGSKIEAGQSNVSVTASSLYDVSGNTELFTTSNTGRTLSITATALIGAGNLSMTGNSTNRVVLSATNASSYTGTILWGDANNTTLEFDNDFTTSGGLIALSTSRIELHQTISFTNLTIDGDVLSPGTYSYATLNTTYNDIFVDGGSGSITVVPEPSFYAALASILMFGFTWARKRK